MAVLVGDCVERMRELDAGSVDAIVTDPPYGLEFMGKGWDRLGDVRQRGDENFDAADDAQPFGRVRHGGSAAYRSEVGSARAMQAWHEAWAREALRVLKPGGHLVAFGGTRTYHRLACAIEDAGFEIRDCLMWLYGSGFPKSLDVSKAIDKAAGAEREVIGEVSARMPQAQAQGWGNRGVDNFRDARRGTTEMAVTAPATPEAERWSGWGTALKPAWEPVVVARKPLVGTVAGNVLAHGTGALNVDGCRLAFASASDESESKSKNRHADFGSGARENAVFGEDKRARGEHGNYDPVGRWPANVVLAHDEDCVRVGERQVRGDGHSPNSRGSSGYGAGDGSNAGGLHGHDGLEERSFDGELVEAWACVPGCPVRLLDAQTGELGKSSGSSAGTPESTGIYGGAFPRGDGRDTGLGDRGGASRFFYCAKASRAERNAGLDGFEPRPLNWSNGDENPGSFQRDGTDRSARNPHPTVKPIDLMRWLVRLVTPPGGLVLDPFVGSGTTGAAAVLEGFEFVGIERDPEYAAIAEARIGFWLAHPTGLPVEQALAADVKRRRTREAGQLGFDV